MAKTKPTKIDAISIKALRDLDEYENSLSSITNSLGKQSDAYKLINKNLEKTNEFIRSTADLIEHSTELTVGNKKAILKAADAYKDTKKTIADSVVELSKGEKTQSEYNKAIIDSYKNYQKLVDSIDTSTKAGKATAKAFREAKKEMESFAEAAKRSEKSLEGINTALDQIGSSGIPLTGQLSDVFKKMANNDIPAAKTALVALGAAASALAMNYFGAPMQVAIETYFDKQQNLIDGAKELAKIGVEKGFIDRKGTKLDKIGLEIIQSQIDNRNELNRLDNERNFASQRAAIQFSATMKSNTVEFQAAAKTGLFGNSIGGVGYAAGQLQLAGIGADQIASAMTAAADATGKMPTGKIGSDMAVMAARTGQSAEGIASINESFQRMDGMSADTAMNMQEGLRTMAKQANINLGGLMSEMAESSKEMLGYQIKSGSSLAKQVTFARSMGVSFQDIAKAGQGMVLNYKDSIKAEMSLSAMLGKNVDLSEVRAKFASGDTEGALKALKAQGLDPASMDMFQQQQLQQATGMDLTTLSKINKNTGRGGGELKAGAAGAENQSFLSRTQSAQATLTSQQAIISADQAIIDATLSQKITESYLKSPGYLRYQNELAMQQKNQANLNVLIQKALLDSDALQKLKAKEKQLGTERGIGENVLSLGAGVAGGLISNKLLSKAGSSLFGKGVSTATAGGGAGVFSKVGGKALGGITAAGIEGYMEYQDNKSKGIGTGENVARTAQVAAGAGGGAWAGAATGAALGSLAGPIGTVIGGLIGGALGAWGGGALGKAAGNAEFGDKDKMVTPAKIAAVTPGNTSVTTTISNSEKFLQDKLTYMSGNLERVVDRTNRTMINTAATTKELTTLNTNTKAIMNLTKTIEALTVATYQGSRDVSVKIDGKKVAYSYNKYTENTKSTGPGNTTPKK